MATLATYFRDFLAEIRPTANQRQGMQTGHKTLRERLNSYEPLQTMLVSDFLQGSYRRSTAIRPASDERSDVDIVVVTNLDREEHSDPQEVMELFRPFVDEYYEGKYEFHGRSIGIELTYVDLDLVITSAPSETDQKALQWTAIRSIDSPEDVSDWRFNEYWVPTEARSELSSQSSQSRLFKSANQEQWKAEPLWIPDRDAGEWEATHPIAQIQWAFDKNKATNGHFVNVVKSIKWWWRVQHPSLKYPKGYPLEHIIGDCCPDGIESVGEGLAKTFGEIRDRYKDDVESDRTPALEDRGVDQNVLKRISADDFADFHAEVTVAAELSVAAYEEEDPNVSARLWRELLGSKFPEPPEVSTSGSSGGAAAMGGFSERKEFSVPTRGRFG